MCASYESRFNISELRIEFALADHQPAFNLQPRGDIRPTVPAPFVYRDGQDRLLAEGRFGIWKPWMAKKRLSTFNARCETTASSRLFGPLLRSRRALIPAMAYHEWTGPKGGKTRWRFTVDGGAPFAFAGLWDSAVAGEGDLKDVGAGETVNSFTILTCEPNPKAAEYHNRMPVVLDAADWSTWLHPEADPAPLLRAFPAERMEVAESPR